MKLGRLLPTLLVLAMPATASASDFQHIFGDYKSDGQLNGCYSPQQLHNAGREIPPDVEQYAPGFGDALAGAQSRCSSPAPAPADKPDEPQAPVSAGTPGPDTHVVMKKNIAAPPAPDPPPTTGLADIAGRELTPSSATATAAETPGALVALLVAAGIAVLLALAWSVAWFMGWSTERLTKPVFAAFESVWDRLLPGR